MQARTKRRLRRPDQPDPRPDPNPNPNPNPLITTDSTTAPPPQKKRFTLTNVSWVLDTRRDCYYENKHLTTTFFLVDCKGLSNDAVGVARGSTMFQEMIRPGGLVSEPAIFVKEKGLGGATVRTTLTLTPTLTPTPTLWGAGGVLSRSAGAVLSLLYVQI